MYSLFLATALSIAPAQLPQNCAPGQFDPGCYFTPQVDLHLPCPPSAILPCFNVMPPRPPCPSFCPVIAPCPVRGPVVNTRPCPCPPQNQYCPYPGVRPGY